MSKSSGYGDGPRVKEFSSLENLLWLVPTDIEKKKFLNCWEAVFGQVFPYPLHLCGFGPIASGIIATRLLNGELIDVDDNAKYSAVVLLGIAGSYQLDLAPIGEAFWFSGVRCDVTGVGANEEAYREQVSFPFGQFPPLEGRDQVEEDLISLVAPIEDINGKTLLTVGRCSADETDRSLRKSAYPDVIAEDMEAYSVASASFCYGIPCGVIRGVSNAVGERNPGSWKVDQAIEAVCRKIYENLFHKNSQLGN